MEQDNLATLRAELDAARAAAARDEAVLTQLAETLQWDGAPRSLRTVLPLARLLRRVSGGGITAILPPPAAPVGARRGLGTRIAMRLFDLTRPVSLPLARRMHRLLGRVLEREDIVSQREAATGSAPAATAELLRSIESAMLTLALQRRFENP
jgi:hypothetical protein